MYEHVEDLALVTSSIYRSKILTMLYDEGPQSIDALQQPVIDFEGNITLKSCQVT